MITRLGHAAYWCENLEKTADFYVNILGLTEAFRMINDDGTVGSIHIRVADFQFIELFQAESEKVSQPNRSVSYSHICFEVDNAATSIEEIRAKGAPIDTELKMGKSKCIQFWTHDPDGNSIELMELPPDSLQAISNARYNENK